MTSKPKEKIGAERRRARRTAIQESFNLFLVIPELLGMAKIYMRDISKLGLSFRMEIDLEIKQNQELKARVYLNPAFYLPLDCKVMRIHKEEYGVEFTQPEAEAVKTLAILQDFFDAAEKSGVFVE